MAPASSAVGWQHSAVPGPDFAGAPRLPVGRVQRRYGHGDHDRPLHRSRRVRQRLHRVRARDCPASTTFAPTIEDNDIAGMTTIDLSGSYKFDSFELFGTIENLTNKQPPTIGGSLSSAHWSGQGNADYDRVGRQYRLGVRFKLLKNLVMGEKGEVGYSDFAVS